MTEDRIDHDQLFKNLLREFFQEFMELFFQKQARAIDFRKVTFLDKEYFTDIPRGRRRELDLVVKVGLRDGGEEYVLVHTEFEAKKDPGFPHRMFQYYAQLYLRHGKPIIPIAIFADDAVWRKPVSDKFEIGFKSENYIRFRYHLLKLKSHTYREFLRKENPIGFAFMAKAQYDRRQRVRLKADFLRLILRAKVNPARRSVLIEFVESYMRLNTMEQARFTRMVSVTKKYREVKKMVTVYEKQGIEKGLEQGLEQGLEKGMAEASKKIARKLRAEGMATRDIMRLTGLSDREVRRLR